MGLKRTPLFEVHQKLGARLVEFGGWEMPVQYTSIVDEHHAVRHAAGLFDISHMGEITVTGPQALAFLNHVLTNDAAKLDVGLGQYTLLCNEHGGTIDDLYLYRIGPAEFLMIVNASRIEADFAWLEKQFSAQAAPETQLVNCSQEFSAMALQGPKVIEFIDAGFTGPSSSGTAVANPSDLKKNQIAQFQFDQHPVWVARTGYTGEDGFEVVVSNHLAARLWEHLLNLGLPFGLKPAGLGARDTLRTEMGYPLYGHELDERTSPIEAGLGRFVAFDKPDFIGRTALAQLKTQGPTQKCVAFTMTDRSAPPRPHYAIWDATAQSRIGEVVSGTQSPSLNIGIGLGYVPLSHAQPGTTLWIEIRGKHFPARVVPKPIYKKPV